MNDLPSQHPAFTLSNRERQALQLKNRGYSTARIAEEMGIAPGTVSEYIQRAREKLGISNPRINRSVRHENALGLSPAEYRVYELVVKGLSNKEVGDKLFVHEKTVKFHLTSIYKRLRIKTRAQLIIQAHNRKVS